ncbi:hypothetical protein BH11PSE6_BH11PSE6_03780 [soil metagenome]
MSKIVFHPEAGTRRWLVRLINPIIFGTKYHGIGRQEVVSTLILQSVPRGAMCPTPETVIDYWKSIDWDRSEPIEMQDFECCDLEGAMVEASRQAHERAEAYCKVAAEYANAGYEYSHDASMAELRLVTSDGEDVA